MNQVSITRVVVVLIVAATCIGLWLFFLAAEPVATITREGIVLYQPPPFVKAVMAFVMLSGVTLGAIQIAWLLEQWHKRSH